MPFYNLNPTFKYKVLLNGEELKNVALGVSSTEKAEESFDDAGFNIPITTKDIEYEMYGMLQIISKSPSGMEKTFDFLIISDSVELSGKYGFFEHKVRVTEFTEKLNNYFVDTLVNTLQNEDVLNTEAQFTIENTNFLYFDTGISYRRVVEIPYIDFKDTYYSGDNTFPQVEQGKIMVYPYGNPDFEILDRDMYIQLDGGSIQNISSSGVTLNLTVGKHEIKYGVMDVPNDGSGRPTGNVPIYTFYINVIREYKYTLYDVVQRLRNIKPFETQEYHSTTRIFDIDDEIVVNGFTLKEILEQTDAPQFFIQHTTMFQALCGIFKYINSIPRLLHTDFESNDKLSRDDFNEIIETFNLEGNYDYDSNQDVQLYATKGISPLQRTLPSNLNKPNIETPANNFFKTVRATNVQLTENDGQFGLPIESKLYKLTKLEVFIPSYDVVTIEFSTQEKITISNAHLDLTRRFLDERFWKLLDNTNVWEASGKDLFEETIGMIDRKTDALFWRQNDNFIDISSMVEGVITKTELIDLIIKQELYRLYSYKLFNDFPMFDDISGTANANAVEIDIDIPSYDDLRFNIEYITLQDYNVVQNREDNEIINRYSEISLKQSDKQLNVELASRKSYGELQRGALPNYTVSKIYYDLDKIKPLFSIDDEGYVITQRSIKFFNTHLDVSYYCTKDHNRLQEFIGVNQEYRPFEIPTSNMIYDRKEVYNDIIYIKKHTDTLSSTKNLIAPLFYYNMLKTFRNELSPKKITFATYYTPERETISEQKEYILLPVNVVGAKQTIMISMGFNDNQVAGDMIEELVNDEMATLKYNKPVRYTDLGGKLDEMWFAVFSDIDDIVGEDLSLWFDLDTYDYNLYPLIEVDTDINATILSYSYMNNGMVNGSSSVHGTYNPFLVYKDSSESIYIQYGVSFKSLVSKQFIVGQAFTANNPLVSNDLVDLYLYKIVDNTKYGIFNDLKIKNYGSLSKVLLDSSNVSLNTYTKGAGNHGVRVQFGGTATSLLSGASGWAIGDINGNLYLACNEVITDFDFEGTHIDPKVKEIGKNRNY